MDPSDARGPAAPPPDLAAAGGARRRERFLEDLHETTLELLTSADRADLLRSIVERAAQLFDATLVELCLREGETLVTAAASANAAFLVGERVGREVAPLSWQVVDDNAPLTLEDYAAHPMHRDAYRSVLPLRVLLQPVPLGDRCVGVLALARSRGAPGFGAEESTHAAMLARTIALVLRHTALREDALRDAEAHSQALQVSERRLRQMFDTALDAIITMDAAGLIVEWNPQAEAMFGWRAEDAIGRDLAATIIPVDQRAAHTQGLQRHVASGENAILGKRLEMTALRRDGREIPVELTVNAITAGDQRLFSAFIRDLSGRRAVEAKLRGAERRYQQVARNINDALMVDDIDGRVVYANDRFLTLFGIGREQLAGLRLEDYVAPEWREELRLRHEERIRGRYTPAEFEYEGLRSDGSRLWIAVSVSVVVENGRAVGTQSLLRDVTARRRREAALMVLARVLPTDGAFFDTIAARLAQTLRVTHAFVGRLVDGGRIRTIGWHAEDGAAPAAEYGTADTPCETALHRWAATYPEDVRELFPADARLTRWGVTGYAAVAMRDASGQPLGLIGVMTDAPILEAAELTEILQLFATRVAAEIGRQALEQRFRTLFDAAPDATLIVDRAGAIVLANDRSESVLGWSSAELTGTTLEWLVPAASRSKHPALMDSYFEDGIPRPMGLGHELHALHKDGRQIPVEVSLSPIVLGGERHVVAAVRDLSARIKLQAQLLQAQRLETVGMLASGIAHDFNNLLTAINATAKVAVFDLPPGSPLRRDFELIGAAGERGAELVRRLMSVGGRQAMRPVSFDIDAMLSDLVPILRRLLPTHITLRFAAGATLPPVWMDRGQLEQVVMNLVANARDAMPNGGTLVLETSTVDTPPATAPEARVVLAVRDSGVGMDPQTLARVFEPFFTTKSPGKGTGLGLATAYGIIKRSGGELVADSEPGRGTTMKVFLPVSERPPEHAMPSSSRAARGGHEKIVVVDDDDLVREVAERVLTSAGYRVASAVDGDDALRMIAASPEQVRLVVTDVVMPEVGGSALAARLATEHPGIKVLFTSGYTEDQAIQQGLVGTRHRFLSKPYAPRELLRTVRELLDEPDPAE